jgi:hypothetical protein
MGGNADLLSGFGKCPTAHFAQYAKTFIRGHPRVNFLVQVGFKPIHIFLINFEVK